VTYVSRRYDEIVRDLLTTLTGGTVRESLTVPAGDAPLVLPRLVDRPVRRVSHLEGFIEAPGGPPVPYRFTAADFELFASDPATGPDRIRFRRGGRRPAPGTLLVANYYPVDTAPVPLTDVSVGSVVRTLLETLAREQALGYAKLQEVYRSAFLDTAEGSALDRVVALVGVRRIPVGHPIARIRFVRRAGAAGAITVPAGTAVTDAAGNRYLTVADLAFDPSETTRQVTVVGEQPGTKLVEAGKLDRLETAIAGISEVSNEQPAYAAPAVETDEALRRRARGALFGAVRGTVEAIRFGLLSVPGVRHVGVVEAPNDVPGEIALEVSYEDDRAEVRAQVAARLEELRPAGIRVLRVGDAGRRVVDVRVHLTLAGGGVAEPELGELTAALRTRLSVFLAAALPGATIRRGRLVAIALEDARIADARIVLVPANGAETEELTLGAGEVIEARTISFPPPGAERAGTRPPARVTVSLPLHLVAGVTAVEARNVIQLALAAHLGSRAPGRGLTLDGIAAAVRDDTRFAVVRKEALVTVERGDRFVQLADLRGSFEPQAGEPLELAALELDVREGAIG